ncbi:MAG: S1C family serine protease [Coriobacteriales bacterium]
MDDYRGQHDQPGQQGQDASAGWTEQGQTQQQESWRTQQAPPVPPQSSYQAGGTAGIPVSPQIQPQKGGRPSRRSVFVTALVAVIIGLIVGGLIVGMVAKGRLSSRSSASSGSSSGTINITTSSEDASLAEAVAAKVLPSVVSVNVYTQSSSMNPFQGASSSSETQSGLGSGVILTSDGYILTNNHVVEGASSVTAKIDDQEYAATVVGTDSSSDLAVIKIDATGLTPIEVGSSSDLVVGQWVMAAGSPYGLEKSVSTGIISALYRSTSMQSSTGLSIYANMIQTDAAVNPGNSGGALVDENGKLIGINTLIESNSGSNAGIAFAIPVDYAMKIADQLKNGETVQHAYLGVSLATVNSSNAQSAGLSVSQGAYVADVQSGTPAASAGLQRGDVITKINGTTVATASEAIIQVRSCSPGDTVEIEYVRGNSTQTTQATLTGSTDSSSGYNNYGDESSQASPQGSSLSLVPSSYDVLTQNLTGAAAA